MATRLVNKRAGGMRTGPGATTAAPPRLAPPPTRVPSSGVVRATPTQPYSRGRLGVGGRSKRVR